MSIFEGLWVSEQVEAAVSGYRKAKMLAHRYKEPEVARSIHASCLSSAEYHAERGNVCMAHAKRLQAKYWARRAFGPFDQPMRYGDWGKIGDEQEQWAWRHA